MSRKPKRVFINALAVAMENAAKLPTAQVTSAQHAITATLAVFRSGHRCAHAWPIMVDALNIAEQLSQLGIASDVDSRARITAGQAVLGAVLQRRNAGGSWTLRAAELNALDDALWTHNIQIAHCSRSEYDKAVLMAQRITSQALAGNAGPSVQVLQVLAGALT